MDFRNGNSVSLRGQGHRRKKSSLPKSTTRWKRSGRGTGLRIPSVSEATENTDALYPDNSSDSNFPSTPTPLNTTDLVNIPTVSDIPYTLDTPGPSVDFDFVNHAAVQQPQRARIGMADLWEIGDRIRGPDLDSSDASDVCMLNVIGHTVVFIFTEVPPGGRGPFEAGRRFTTAARIWPFLSSTEARTLIADLAELALIRGRVRRIKIWTNEAYNTSLPIMDELRRHGIGPNPRPSVDYYTYDPNLPDGVPQIRYFCANQLTRSTGGGSWPPARQTVRFSPSTDHLLGDVATRLTSPNRLVPARRPRGRHRHSADEVRTVA